MMGTNENNEATSGGVDERKPHFDPSHPEQLPADVTGVVITVSDTCASGKAVDESGPAAVDLLERHGLTISGTMCVHDGYESVAAAIESALESGAKVVFTTGGTGISPRDETPEATKDFLETQLPAVAYQIVSAGLSHTPLAGLSRALVGITGYGEAGALIVNAPGNPAAVADAVGVVGPLIPHILRLIRG